MPEDLKSTIEHANSTPDDLLDFENLHQGPEEEEEWDEDDEDSDLEDAEPEEDDLDTEDDDEDDEAYAERNTEGEDGHPFLMQFAESKEELNKLRELVNQGIETGINRVKAAADKIKDLPLDQALDTLAQQIEAELRGLQPGLAADLATDSLVGHVGGLLEPLSRIPAKALPLLPEAPIGPGEALGSPLGPTLSPIATPAIKGPSGPPTSLYGPLGSLPPLPWGTVTRLPPPGSFAPPPGLPWGTVTEGLQAPTPVSPLPPIEPELVDQLFPEAEEVHLPALTTAIDTLRKAPLGLGSNYKETAELVKKGAFAITADMTDKAIEDVRNTLADTIEKGLSQKEFIKTVSERLEEEGSPLSPPHIENVFRSNTLAAYSKAQKEAVEHPVVTDFFPYASIWVTDDARARARHKAMGKYSPPSDREDWSGGGPYGLNGTNVYRIDDPVFIKFRGPWDYNCRCGWSATTVEQAARAGVKEAVEWLERAKGVAAHQGGTFYVYLNRVAPHTPEFVQPPPFNPPEEFKRDLGVA